MSKKRKDHLFKPGCTPGPGRPRGTPNRVTAEVRTLAQEYGPEAIETLVSIMRISDQPSAKIAACKELLDRGYGRSTIPLPESHKADNNIYKLSMAELEAIILEGREGRGIPSLELEPLPDLPGLPPGYC